MTKLFQLGTIAAFVFLTFSVFLTACSNSESSSLPASSSDQGLTGEQTVPTQPVEYRYTYFDINKESGIGVDTFFFSLTKEDPLYFSINSLKEQHAQKELFSSVSVGGTPYKNNRDILVLNGSLPSDPTERSIVTQTLIRTTRLNMLPPFNIEINNEVFEVLK